MGTYVYEGPMGYRNALKLYNVHSGQIRYLPLAEYSNGAWQKEEYDSFATNRTVVKKDGKYYRPVKVMNGIEIYYSNGVIRRAKLRYSEGGRSFSLFKLSYDGSGGGKNGSSRVIVERRNFTGTSPLENLSWPTRPGDGGGYAVTESWRSSMRGWSPSRWGSAYITKDDWSAWRWNSLTVKTKCSFRDVVPMTVEGNIDVKDEWLHKKSFWGYFLPPIWLGWWYRSCLHFSTDGWHEDGWHFGNSDYDYTADGYIGGEKVRTHGGFSGGWSGKAFIPTFEGAPATINAGRDGFWIS